jgi:hypothetical protein
VKKSELVTAQVEIYTLLYEADEWEKAYGRIELTDLQKALLQGKLNGILKAAVKLEEEGSIAAVGALREASANLEELKGKK